MTLTKIPPRRGFRLKYRLVQELGPLFIALAGGVKIGDEEFSLPAVLSSPKLVQKFGGMLLEQLAKTQAEELEKLLADCSSGLAVVEWEEEGEKHSATLEGETEAVVSAFDEAFMDSADLLAFAWAVLEFQFLPTSPARTTDEDSASGKSTQ